VILTLNALLVVALGGAAMAPSVHGLAITSYAVGLFGSMIQQIIPMAAQMAPASERGRIIGTVMSGLLLGILFGRFVAGMLGTAFGWRAVFAISAGAMVPMLALLARLLPRLPISTGMSYAALLGSILRLAGRHPALRTASAKGGLLFACFSVFWVALTPLLTGPTFGFDARAAGLFGLLGAAGALAAPLAGRAADRGGPDRVMWLAVGLVAASFVLFGVSGESLVGLAIGTVVMDLGVQGGMIANQTRIFGIEPEARSRVNAFYMTCYFAGGAIGSVVAGLTYAALGWTGAMAAGLVFALLAGAVHLFERRVVPARP
jgi:predicted MFS family arabinose efflux permease